MATEKKTTTKKAASKVAKKPAKKKEDKRIDNLIPFNELTEKEHRELAAKGGKASVEARRQKKSMREALEQIMSLDIKNPHVIEELKKLGLAAEDMDNGTALAAMLFSKALKPTNIGNKAYELIRDTTGQKEVEKVKLDLPMQFVFKDDYGDEEE